MIKTHEGVALCRKIGGIVGCSRVVARLLGNDIVVKFNRGGT